MMELSGSFNSKEQRNRTMKTFIDIIKKLKSGYKLITKCTVEFPSLSLSTSSTDINSNNNINESSNSEIISSTNVNYKSIEFDSIRYAKQLCNQNVEPTHDACAGISTHIFLRIFLLISFTCAFTLLHIYIYILVTHL